MNRYRFLFNPLFTAASLTIAVGIVFALTFTPLGAEFWPVNLRLHHLEIGAMEEGEESEGSETRFDEAATLAEFYRLKRVPAGASDIPMERYQTARARMAKMRRYSTALGKVVQETDALGKVVQAPDALGSWSLLGPGNTGGRTRAIVIHPTNVNIMFAAGVAGGVWKTTNGGTSWAPISDLIANLAVCSLVIDPTNPNVLYAGTGEGFFGNGSVRGNGIFKTNDGGANWTQLTATASNSNFYYVNDLVVSPSNGQRLYAATSTGVWRSTNGGTSWSQVLNPNVAGGCTDLAIRTDATGLANDYIFAACGNFAQATVYLNTDAGGAGTWNGVLTEANMGRTSLALAPSNQNVVYALSASLSNLYGGDALHKVFRSTTGGGSGTWSARVTNNGDSTQLKTLLLTNVGQTCTNQFFSQGWYDNVIAVDPVNENRVWAGGVNIFRSDDGGANWGYVPCWGHVDYHVITFQPGYDGVNNKTMFVGTDGGIFKTTDATGTVLTTVPTPPTCSASCNVLSFSPLNNSYATTQFYHGAPYPDGMTYFGGTQDNGTLRGSDAGGLNSWNFLPLIQGGDGGFVTVDPTNTNTLYALNLGISIQKSTNGGTSFSLATTGINDTGATITPFVMDPTNSQRLWTGGSFLWRTSNGAGSWTQASAALAGGQVSAIAVSPLNANNVLAGTSLGYIHRTTVGTTSTSATAWPNVRPRTGYVSGITYDPANALVAYATYSTFNSAGNVGHVFKSVDGGANWTSIDGTLPDVPVHTIVVDPTNSQRLYIGTDLGVFSSLDGGTNWAVENTGFANVITEALAINTSGTKYLFAFTHGRGVWRVPLSGGNTAPTISDITNQTISKNGSTGALAFTVNDAETPAASLTLSGSSSDTTLVPNVNIVFGGSGTNRTVTVTPASNQTGTATITITVSDANGGQASDTFLLTVNGPLVINSVSPPAGRIAGGQSVKLTGSFVNLTSVTVGGVTAAWSNTNGTSEITVTTPAHAVGAVDIVLTPNSGGPYTKSNAFAYLPTTFTDNTLVVGVTTAKAQHVTELRQAVNALRAVAGLGAASWTDTTLSPTSTLIKAVHITELRTNLEQVAGLLGYSAGSYTEPGLSIGFVIKRVHIEELRQRIRNLAG